MTTTTSRVLLSGIGTEDRELLRKWADYAASKGGSFRVTQEYTDSWYVTYVINWPTGTKPEEVKP